MLGVLCGVSVLRKPDWPSGASESSYELKQDQSIERAGISSHTTDNLVSFRVQPTDDAHSRRLVPDDQSQRTFKGLARNTSVQVGEARSAQLGPQLTLVVISVQFLWNKGCYTPRYTGGPQTTKINRNHHRIGGYTFMSIRGGL